MNTFGRTPLKAVVGLDLGHSRIKAVLASVMDKDVTRHKISFPTLVSQWHQLKEEFAAQKALTDTVDINGQRFFIGATVQEQNNPTSYVGVHYDWFRTLPTQYQALTKGAFKKLRPKMTPTPGLIVVVVGLPAASSTEDRNELERLTREAIEPELQVGEVLKIVKSATQADAIVFHALFNEDGSYNTNYRQESTIEEVVVDGEIVEKETPASLYGVIEVGHLTTDFTILSGIYGIDSATNSTSGVSSTFAALQELLASNGFYNDLPSTAEALMMKKLEGRDVSHLVKKASSDLIQETLSTAKEVFSRRRLDGLLVAGGGASLVIDAIKSEFPRAEIIPEARFAVAEGYVRRGLIELHK